MRFILLAVAALSSTALSNFVRSDGDLVGSVSQEAKGYAPIPKPEPIEITELPLPPVLTNTTEGACSLKANPRSTGCIASFGLISGSFTPDGKSVTASVTFVGAPAAPNPASIFTGIQLILIKADGTKFPNGDTWKCVTCGVPASHQVGVTPSGDYPQTFVDGKRILIGTNIVECRSAQLVDKACTPNNTFIYPLRLSNKANDDGSGAGAPLRELRLHPDNVHLTFNSFTVSSSGSLGQTGFFGRLQFNATGSRYDLINVTALSNPYSPQFLTAKGDQLFINRSAIVVGELRGLTGTGKEIIYIGPSWESCNIDLFAADLTTGAVRRVTAHPEYADPIAVSPDDKWQVVLDTRGTDRTMFMSGLRTVPPLTDLVTVAASSSVRNNGIRRFFQPYLLDHDGDRGLYFGQKINAAGDGSPGSINDPNWNAGADPRWSLDGTRVVYYQWLARSPACGGSNPLKCEPSPYADGRQERVMVAKFSSRKPLPIAPVPEASDVIPWGLKYVPGMTFTTPSTIPAGKYILYGNATGHANVSMTGNPVNTVSVAYYNFSDDGKNFLSGYENATVTPLNVTLSRWDWYSDIKSNGPISGSKVTSDDGFHFTIDIMYNNFVANGTLKTTIEGLGTYGQPCNYC